MPRAVSNSSPLIHLAAIISSLGAELARLRDEASFWINEAVYRRAMAAVGEATDSPEKQ